MAPQPLILRFDFDDQGGLKKINQVTDELDRMGREVDQTSKKTGSFETVFGKLGRGLSRVRQTIFSVQGAFAALAGSFFAREITKTISGFDQAIAGVRAVSGATAAEMEKVVSLTRDLGASTRFSATEAGEGFKFLSQAGFEVNQAIAALPATLNLAEAGGLGLARSADIVSNILSGFGEAADQTGRATDILAKIAASANTNIEQLGDAMSFVAPVAAAAGISIEETAAGIGVLSNAGIQGGRAGRNLRGVLSSLGDPSDEARAAIESLGLSIAELDPTTNSIQEIFSRFADAELDLKTATQIFGKEMAAAALALSSSSEELANLTEKAFNAQGAVDQMSAIMRDTLEGDLKTLQSAFQELILTMGDKGFRNAARGVIQGLTDIVKSATESDALADIAAGFQLIVENLDKLVIAAKAYIALQLGVSLLAAAESARSLAVAIKAAQFSFAGLNTTMKASVIGLILWGAVEAALYLRENAEVVRAAWIRTSRDLQSGIVALRVVYLNNADKIGLAFQLTWEAILTFFSIMVESIKAIFVSFINFIERKLAQTQNLAIDIANRLASIVPGIQASLERAVVPEKLTLGDELSKVLEKNNKEFRQTGDALTSTVVNNVAARNEQQKADLLRIRNEAEDLLKYAFSSPERDVIDRTKTPADTGGPLGEGPDLESIGGGAGGQQQGQSALFALQSALALEDARIQAKISALETEDQISSSLRRGNQTAAEREALINSQLNRESEILNLELRRNQIAIEQTQAGQAEIRNAIKLSEEAEERQQLEQELLTSKTELIGLQQEERNIQSEIAAIEQRRATELADLQADRLREQNKLLMEQIRNMSELDQVKLGLMTGFAEAGVAAQDFFTMAKSEATNLVNTLESGFTRAFEGFVRGTTSAQEAFNTLGNAIISWIIQMIAKMIFQATIGRVLAAAAVKQSQASASSLALSWTPAAIAASIATQGGAAASGAAAFTGAMVVGLGVSTGMGALASASGSEGAGTSFHSGGLVGGDGVKGRNTRSDEVDAVLQRGEYVVSRRGVALLDQINQGVSGLGGPQGGGETPPVVNFLDPSLLDSYLATRQGRNAIVNIIREEQQGEGI